MEMVKRAKIVIDKFCLNRTLVFVTHNPDELPLCITKSFKLHGGLSLQREGFDIIQSRL